MRRTTLVRTLFFARSAASIFVAFRSLGSQVKGLYGRRGIRPIASYLDAIRPSYRRVSGCATSRRSSGSTPRTRPSCAPAALVRSARSCSRSDRAANDRDRARGLLYLSFVSVGRDILAYQWDVLLLENGLHAIVLGAVAARRAAAVTPSR